MRRLLVPCSLLLLVGCEPASRYPHGDIGSGVMARLGDVVPSATDEQKATFTRGLAVARRRFELADGLGPAFNVTFCAACHERPVTGGSAGLYRNFALTGMRTADGVFFPGTSAGRSGGVLRMYAYAPGVPARPPVPETTTIIAQRNPIPVFGTGLVAEIPEEEILAHQDPSDADGDGISGRPNYEKGFVGRFGRKAQTASVEGFIRGPLFNHAGITTSPLTDEQRARLPVDSSSHVTTQPMMAALSAGGLRSDQAAVTDEVLTDDDGVPDPELSREDLFDVVSFSMLLAIAEVEPKTDETERGREIFDDVGCGKCHVPRLNSRHGPLPIYSDLLLHDMGPDLADGIEQGLATGSEFRTQPLWGVGAEAPYLHDGRAATLEEAILLHGGEAKASRDRIAARGDGAMVLLVEFLRSLGGRDQTSDGLIPPSGAGAEIPGPGEYGGPLPGLDPAELTYFLEGRALFDRDFGFDRGLGAPRFNGDSCRACHFDPVVGGSGPRDVNVMRHGILGPSGEFIVPDVGTILHKDTRLLLHANIAETAATIFEHRQTPHLFGLGLVDQIPDSAILANADPDDAHPRDGISGRASFTDDGRLGRFGWKAQVPSVAEFVRDAAGAELGLTVERQEGLTFGRLQDDDDVPDPELPATEAQKLAFYLRHLGPPPRQNGDDAAIARGRRVFEELGCAKCHLPSLPSPTGPVPLYSDLLLHEILPEGAAGIEDGAASMREFRTAPLWGLAKTAPYWHSGQADTIEQAIELHEAEGAKSRDDYRALTDARRADLLALLRSL